MRLTKYEKETIIRSSEGEKVYDIYTFNPNLKRKLANFARKYPELCKQTGSARDGGVTYEVKKSRVAIQLMEPYSETNRKVDRKHGGKRFICMWQKRRDLRENQ